jgi:uncharacterized protein
VKRFVDRKSSSFRLKIGSSLIKGRGVFAAEPIPRNRKVIEYCGELVTWGQAAKMVRRSQRMGQPVNVYLARLNNHWLIDGTKGGNGAELINHSCDPNLRVGRIKGHLLLFSRRQIRAGEELTYDYRYRRAPNKTPCLCGAAGCRGFINRK